MVMEYKSPKAVDEKKRLIKKKKAENKRYKRIRRWLGNNEANASWLWTKLMLWLPFLSSLLCPKKGLGCKLAKRAANILVRPSTNYVY